MDNRFFERPNVDVDGVRREITWNPDLSPCLSPWLDQRQCAARVRRGERVIKGFCGREDDPSDSNSQLTEAIPHGQRVYLLRTGTELGMIGSGYTVAGLDRTAYISAPVEDGKVCNYILFDALLDLTSEKPLRGFPTPGPDDPDGIDVNLYPTGSTISAWDLEFDADWRQHVATQRPLQVGQRYTRQEVYEALNVPEQQRGGDWATGYHRHNGNWYLFANVGLPGRTGHDYDNRWIGNELLWRAGSHSLLWHIILNGACVESFLIGHPWEAPTCGGAFFEARSLRVIYRRPPCRTTRDRIHCIG